MCLLKRENSTIPQIFMDMVSLNQRSTGWQKKRKRVSKSVMITSQLVWEKILGWGAHLDT